MKKMITPKGSLEKNVSIWIFILPNKSKFKIIRAILVLLHFHHNVGHLETKTRPCINECICTVRKMRLALSQPIRLQDYSANQDVVELPV